MDITESQVAAAFEGYILEGRPVGVTGVADHVLSVIVEDSGALAKGLFVTLARMAALDEDEPEDEPERCPKCADPELAAMAALLPALPEVRSLDPYTRDRVMDWARRRACDGAPPF